MHVDRVYRRRNATAVVLSGFPDDLVWPTNNSVPKQSMFIQTGDGRLYRIESEQEETERKFADPHVCLRDFLKPEDLWFTLPLSKGNKFCDPDNARRTDGMYCWVVANSEQVRLSSVKGLTGQPVPAYSLEFRTLPDDTEITFVPGLGVVRYAYHHHGTVGETELELVEVHFLKGTSEALH